MRLGSAGHSNKDKRLYQEEALLERCVALCDFWLSPLATAFPLLLDTLPGCPLACHLFKLPPSLLPPLHAFFPRPTRPAMSSSNALIDLFDTRFREPPSLFEFGSSVSNVLATNAKETHSEKDDTWGKISNIHAIFDGSQLKRLFPAVFTVAK